MRLLELTLRYSAANDADGSPLLVGRTIERPSDAAPALVSLLQHEAGEVFVVLCLSTKRRVLGFYEVSRVDAHPKARNSEPYSVVHCRGPKGLQTLGGVRESTSARQELPPSVPPDSPGLLLR